MICVCVSLSLSLSLEFSIRRCTLGIDRERTEKKDGCRGVGTEEKWFLPFLFRRRRRDANVCRMQMWRRGAEVVGSRAGWLRYFPTSHTSRVSAPFNSRNRIRLFLNSGEQRRVPARIGYIGRSFLRTSGKYSMFNILFNIRDT